MQSSTPLDILALQSSLEQEAAEALPHENSKCTYSQGYIRQALYWCVTCAEPRGICTACSVNCHTNHEQVELFPKRHFRCDCPTPGLQHQCTLHASVEDVNVDNTYGPNFKGQFCRCGRPYDPHVEIETMIQCLACEDWFHESCLNLRERPTSGEPSPAVEDQEVPEQNALEENENEDARSEVSDTSSNGLPPPLITASMYQSLICADCVRKNNILKSWAGTPGIMMVVRDQPEEKWQIIGRPAESAEAVDVSGESVSSSPSIGQKRARSSSVGDDPKSKRPRESEESSSAPEETRQRSPCLAPIPNSYAQRIFEPSESPVANDIEDDVGLGDIFLTEGFRTRWCRCSECLALLRLHPFLLEEEETYEPPDDPDLGLSLEELGMRALLRLPRDKAIDGIRAFNEMSHRLKSHLRTIAQEGREVTAADINGFFSEKMATKGNK